MAQARRLLDAAGALPDNPRALHRGQTYRTIFALCYGLGLRAGEACGLRLGDVDPARQLLVVRGGKFGNYAEGAVMPSPVTVARGLRRLCSGFLGIIASEGFEERDEAIGGLVAPWVRA